VTLYVVKGEACSSSDTSGSLGAPGSHDNVHISDFSILCESPHSC